MTNVGIAAARANAARTAAKPHPPKTPTAAKTAPVDPPPDGLAPAAQPPDAPAALPEITLPADKVSSKTEHTADQLQALVEIERQRQTFDAAFARHAELQREINVLVEFAFEQRKRDDEITRACIRLI